MELNLVFLGPPGAGKGTIAQRLCDEYKIPQISTGDILREAAKKNDAFGKKVKAIMEAGQYVDDNTMAEIVKKRLGQKDTKNGFILDGYPRTVKQAELLEGILKALKKKLSTVLLVDATEAIIIDRLSTRISCKKCGKIYNLKGIPPKVAGKCDDCGGELFQRDDDKPAAIKERLRVYNEKTMPLIDYYKKKGQLKTINSNEDLEDNMRNAHAVLKELGFG